MSAGGFPGFPRYCGTGTWQGRPYLVEELLEPRDLPQTDCVCAKYLLAICRSVAELHKRGIVHRDLKPGNILFRENGEPVIVDLGLAKCPTPTGVESDASLENGKPIGVGTPGYAAPEQFMGGDITPVADIHALGVLAQKLIASASRRYSWGGDILVAANWRRIIRRATSSIPSERYPSVYAFAAAIRRRHWPLFVTIAVLILSVALTFTMPVGRDLWARRNPDKTQFALRDDWEEIGNVAL